MKNDGLSEMNEEQQVNTDLTNMLEVWLDTQRVREEPKAPTSPMMTKLSPLTARVMEKHYAQLAKKKKSLRERKRYTRKPGHVHPKKKLATARRRYERRWREDPYSCIVNGWGKWSVDKGLFNELVLPLWKQHDPALLAIKKYRQYGTKEKPHTVFTFDVVNTKSGAVLYSGRDEEIYQLSKPSRVEQ